MSKHVSYPREMREYAKEKDLSLITIDLPGIQMQAPADQEVVRILLDAFKAIQALRSLRNKK